MSEQRNSWPVFMLVIAGTVMLVFGAMLFADVMVGQTNDSACAGVRNQVQLISLHRAKLEADLANLFAEVQQLRQENAQLKKVTPEPKAE